MNGAAIYNYSHISNCDDYHFILSIKNVSMHKFTHEYRLNEHLITLKAFIVYMYVQEN